MSYREQVIKSLSDLAATGDEADRCYACHALGVIGDSEVTSVLTERLLDEDIDVSVDAADALGHLGEINAVGSLIESMFNDPDGEVKIAVVEAMGDIGYKTSCKEIIKPLMEIAANRPKNLIIDETDTWDPWWDMQLKAIEALARMQVKEAIPVLQAVLDDENNQDIECEVLKALANIGKDGEEILHKRLTGGSARQRRRAAIALGNSGTKNAITMLTNALLDADIDVRVAAIDSLNKSDAVEQLPAISLLLNDSDAEVRSCAVRAIQHLSSLKGASNKQLSGLLTDKAPLVRESALKVLSSHGVNLDDETVKLVLHTLEDPDSRVAIAACCVLANSKNKTTHTKLIDVLTDQDRQPEVRAQAALSLGTLGVWNDECKVVLKRTVIDEARQVRLATLDSLLELDKQIFTNNKNLNDKGIERPLHIIFSTLEGNITQVTTDKVIPIIPIQENSNEKQTIIAENFLKTEINDAQTTDTKNANSTLNAIAIANIEANLAIDETIDDNNADLFKQEDDELLEYKEIINQHNKTAEWLFSKESEDAVIDSRYLAARVLGKYSGNDNSSDLVISKLLAVLDKKDNKLNCEAIKSISSLVSQNRRIKILVDVYEVLIVQLTSEDRDVRIACARALGYVKNKNAVNPLLKCLDASDTSLRVQSVYSLTKLIFDLLQDKPDQHAILAIEFIKKLLTCLNDNESGIRSASIKVLPELLKYIKHKETDIQDLVIDKIIDAAFVGEISQAKDIGKALRQLAPEQASAKLLRLLRTLTKSTERRFIIIMLEEIYIKESKFFTRTP